MAEPKWRTTSGGDRYRILSIEEVGPDDPPEIGRNEVKVTIEREGQPNKIVYVPKSPIRRRPEDEP